MAAEKSQNVQDVFLNHVRKNKTAVTVFLVNGVKLQGIITWFDNFSVLLRRDGHTQLVYKHAISTVMPGAPIQLFDGPRAEGEAADAPAPPHSPTRLTIRPRETDLWQSPIDVPRPRRPARPSSFPGSGRSGRPTRKAARRAGHPRRN